MITDDLVRRVLDNDKRGVSRALTITENNSLPDNELQKRLYPHTGKAYIIGITGPPGAGKSTLTDQLAKHVTDTGKKAGVIAVDPTSPFSGGALLGDRIRMEHIHGNPNIFFRSMATRGSLGGISGKTFDAVDVLDAAGYDYIFIETVGVGQSELDIAEAADCTVVVLVPESGDTVQAMKAGLMEIGDIFVMNKSDRPGADYSYKSLKSVLSLKFSKGDDWKADAVQTTALKNEGISELYDTITRFRDYSLDSGKYITKRETRIKKRILQIVRNKVLQEVLSPVIPDNDQGIFTRVAKGEISPYEYADIILSSYKKIANK